MRSMMLTVLAAFLTSTALADPGAIGNETPTAEQAPDKAVAETVDEAGEAEPFKVPAGYQPKKRGKKVVYCKKAMESGTRFSQEKCYSEDQLRAMSAEREQDQANFDQTRKVCANPESCAGS
jgi:hypothetical protein